MHPRDETGSAPTNAPAEASHGGSKERLGDEPESPKPAIQPYSLNGALPAAGRGWYSRCSTKNTWR